MSSWSLPFQRRQWSLEQKDVALVKAARSPGQQSLDIMNTLIQEGCSVGCIRAGTTALCEAVKSGTQSFDHVKYDENQTL